MGHEIIEGGFSAKINHLDSNILKKSKMALFFELAKGTKALPHTNNFPWPYEVALCFETVSKPVAFSEGVGHGSAGGIFTAAEALQVQWADHIKNANAEWLLPFISSMAAGELVDAEQVLQIFRQTHGTEPLSFENQFA
ncbi:hypothetical protein [Undibacterium sp.]|uniref:hypothetical protein n=1 Tax=Undibacterium sp. TaxID=1914977 RepID=UPI00374CBD90